MNTQKAAAEYFTCCMAIRRNGPNIPPLLALARLNELAEDPDLPGWLSEHIANHVKEIEYQIINLTHADLREGKGVVA